MALPNLRRLFVEARTEAEENEYSRNAVSFRLNAHYHLVARKVEPLLTDCVGSSTIWCYSYRLSLCSALWLSE